MIGKKWYILWSGFARPQDVPSLFSCLQGEKLSLAGQPDCKKSNSDKSLENREDLKLAHHKSAKKRIRTSEKRHLMNKAVKSTVRTYIKRSRTYIKAGNLEAAEKAAHNAVRALDRAAEKGILHKNNAARRKSRLMAALNKARTQVQAQQEA